jgi:protein-disulfide isomerase-like protein with CxxC motif
VLAQQQETELSRQGLTEQQKQAINDKYARLKYQNDLRVFQEEDKIKRSQFQRDKALRIAQIAMDTASAIVKAVAASPTTFGMPFSGFAAALGVTQAAAVAAQQYQGGSMPQMPNLSGGVGAGASSFSVGTNTQTTTTNTQTNTQTTPMVTPVVVLEVNDFNEVANKVAVQEAKSMFG